jgi:hypothetical protein
MVMVNFPCIYILFCCYIFTLGLVLLIESGDGRRTFSFIFVVVVAVAVV